MATLFVPMIASAHEDVWEGSVYPERGETLDIGIFSTPQQCRDEAWRVIDARGLADVATWACGKNCRDSDIALADGRMMRKCEETVYLKRFKPQETD